MPRVSDWSLSDATLYVGPDGTVRGLYTETVDLRTLGDLDVRKLSSVDWTGQGWEVRLAAGGSLGTFPTRLAALAAETDHFNAILDEGRTP